MRQVPHVLLGQRVGNYRVTRRLGGGGMGEVFEAEHPGIKRRVAIKVLASRLSQSKAQARRFLGEARAIARIAHANVVEVYDFGELDDGRLYCVMELLQGCELRAVIEAEGRMAPAEVWPFLEQICAGLQAAHAAGVIHRDLKPQNIFVEDGDPPRVTLLDFGLAKLLEDGQDVDRTGTGVVMGTPLFIAPAQAAGEPDRVCPQTDLYALGVLLYLMLTGVPPFTAEVAMVLLSKHITERPPSLLEYAPSTPIPIVKLVEQCLEKAPADRPGSAVAVAERFHAALGGAPAASRVWTFATTVPGPGASSGAAAPAAEQTTMSAAAAEVSLASRRPQRSRAGGLVLVAGLGLALGTGALLLLRRPAMAPARGAPGITADGSAKPDPVRDASSPDGRAAIVSAPDARAARWVSPPKVVRSRRRQAPARRQAAPDATAAPAANASPDAAAIKPPATTKRPTRPAQRRVGEGTLGLPDD